MEPNSLPGESFACFFHILLSYTLFLSFSFLLSSFFLSVFLPTTNNRLNDFDEFSERRSSWLARRNLNEESCTWLLGKSVYSRFSFLFASDVSAIMLDMSRFTSYDFARVRNVVLSRLLATQLYLLRSSIEENRRTRVVYRFRSA